MNVKRVRYTGLFGVLLLLTMLIIQGCAPAAPTMEPAYEEAMEEPAAEEPAYDEVAFARSDFEDNATTYDTGSDIVVPQQRMIIKNGEITLLVENVQTSVDQVIQIIREMLNHV